jgi:DNA-binding NarL/FixJ family response regulator
MSSPQTSILLVEDHQLTRLGLKISLMEYPNYKVVGEAADGEVAVSEAIKLIPDVVLMDIGLPGIDGIEATWRIKRELPRARIIMFTSNNTANDVMAAMGAGADGYCLKNAAIEQIVQAIDKVKQGQIWLDPGVADHVVKNQTLQDIKGANVELSALESQIMKLVRDGKTNENISEHLGTSEETVTVMMRNIVERFALSPFPQAKSTEEKNYTEDWFTDVGEQPAGAGTYFAGKYLIENVLGVGGVGTVFKAKHQYMDRIVALKILQPQYAANRENVKAFQQEARSIANLDHPNIVAVYDFGLTTRHEPYLVMEFIEGRNLESILCTEKKLQLPRFCSIFTQVCDALSVAHKRGVIHCDLKPGNILVLESEDGVERIKLADFGLAKILHRDAKHDNTISDDGSICGTPPYMSPEQCLGQSLDQRSDIYALGSMMFEALMGLNAFASESAYETFQKQIDYVPPRLADIDVTNSIPKELDECVAKMLEKDVSKRCQSVDEVKQVLRKMTPLPASF